MSQENEEHYSVLTRGQVNVSNRLFHYLNQPEIFLFCPTGNERKKEFSLD